jgi:HAD superfamily hydrolase (TIGR01509 family)
MITNQEHQLNIGVHNRGNDILIIFDCDGVLVDSEPIANRIIVQCFQSEGFNVDLTFADKHFIGISTQDCIKYVELQFKRRVSQSFLRNYENLTKREIKRSLQAIPNIIGALELINYPKCIASGSTPEKIKLSLEVTNIYKYFGSIFSATQVKKGKPHPDIFLYASKEMGFKPDHCIVVEDSDPGVQAALAAGMKPLLYRPHMDILGADSDKVKIFNDMSQLPTIIEKWVSYKFR